MARSESLLSESRAGAVIILKRELWLFVVAIAVGTAGCQKATPTVETPAVYDSFREATIPAPLKAVKKAVVELLVEVKDFTVIHASLANQSGDGEWEIRSPTGERLKIFFRSIGDDATELRVYPAQGASEKLRDEVFDAIIGEATKKD